MVLKNDQEKKIDFEIEGKENYKEVFQTKVRSEKVNLEEGKGVKYEEVKRNGNS